MKVGAEPKKIAILALLLLVAAYMFYTNVLTSGEPARPAPRTAARPAAVPASAEQRAEAREAVPRQVLREFRPSLKSDRREQRSDPMTIDPTLRLDLLAKVRSVTMEGGERNLFQFGPAPAPPKPPEPRVIPKPPQAGGDENKPPEAPPKPPPPPIPLKFYGYASQSRPGEKRAFFLDGEDIVVATEGELIKKRYKVVRIGINSAVVEDTEHKHQQTLALEEQSG